MNWSEVERIINVVDSSDLANSTTTTSPDSAIATTGIHVDRLWSVTAITAIIDQIAGSERVERWRVVQMWPKNWMG